MQTAQVQAFTSTCMLRLIDWNLNHLVLHAIVCRDSAIEQRHAGYLHTSSGSTESQLYRSTQVLTVASSQYVTLCRCRLSSILGFNSLCTTFRIMRSTNCAIRQDCNIVGTFQSRDNSFCLVLILFRDTMRKQALQLTETAPISDPHVH